MKESLASLIEAFWDFVDTRGVIRRIVLGMTMWMTFWVSYEMTRFAFRALELDRITGNIPLVIGAITAPIVALGGYVFKAYLDSRSGS